MTLIALGGYASSGKDSTANFLIKYHGFQRVAFADSLREVLYDINPIIGSEETGHAPEPIRIQELVDHLGWDGAKATPEVRELLQRTGMTGRDRISDTIWVDAAFRKVNEIDRCVITDCRFPNELDAVRGNGGYFVRVVRPGVAAVNRHISETALDDEQPDVEIYNDGSIDALGDKVEAVLSFLNIL